MKQRGRKSGASLSVVTPLERPERPPAPEMLSEDQAAVWDAVVRSEDPGLFDSGVQRDLLADYCRHRVSADQISQIVDEFDPQWMKSADGAQRLSKLLQMREREVHCAARLATKLRLTNQSRYTPQRAGTVSGRATSKAPWEW